MRREAREIGETAGEMRHLAGEALDATAAAPTIEGQFGPEVRALGQELHAIYEGEAASLAERAEDLEAIAARFEAVEQELELRLGVITADVCALLEEHERRRRGRVPGHAMPTARGGDGDDEDDEEDESWLEKYLNQMLEQFWKPSLAWMTLTDKVVGRWMARLKNFGPFVLPLPWLQGLGPAPRINLFDPNFIRGTMDDFAGPLMKSIEWDDIVRAAGRAVGDASIVPLFAIGWGVTLLPEQIQNLVGGATRYDIQADAELDSIGFAVGELAGWAFAPLGLHAKIGADVLAGAAWDLAVDANGLRDLRAFEIEMWEKWYGEMLDRVELAPSPEGAATPTPMPPGSCQTDPGSGVVILNSCPPPATATPPPSR